MHAHTHTHIHTYIIIHVHAHTHTHTRMYILIMQPLTGEAWAESCLSYSVWSALIPPEDSLEDSRTTHRAWYVRPCCELVRHLIPIHAHTHTHTHTHAHTHTHTHTYTCTCTCTQMRTDTHTYTIYTLARAQAVHTISSMMCIQVKAYMYLHTNEIVALLLKHTIQLSLQYVIC